MPPPLLSLRSTPAAFLLVIAIWYTALTLSLGFWPGEPVDHGLAFNSMARYLLAGRFDIDPDAIGSEGFESQGGIVAYFGIFCALLRIPLVLLPGYGDADVTWWSCLIAACLGAWLQARTVLLVCPRNWLSAALLASVVFGGAHVQFLHVSIFQETTNWAVAQSMGFVLLAMRGLTGVGGFDRRTLCGMALCAGLALLTRVTFGVGLYAAMGFLLVTRGPRSGPVLILLGFASVAGIVNWGRWGNPLVFADYTKYLLSQDYHPDRLVRLAAYGTFNPRRIWLTLIYYFVPIWIWVRTDGHVLFAEAQFRLMDAMELPPGSFFLTDPFLLILAAIGVSRVRDRVHAGLLLGLAAAPVLILCAISTAHRYRMEFYPALFLAALFAPYKPAPEQLRKILIGAAVLGIGASHVMAVIYAVSPMGPGAYYLERYGLIGTFTRSSW